MLPITAVWIDSEEHLVQSFRSHLNSEDILNYSSPTELDLLTKFAWKDIDLVLLELRANSGAGLDLVPELRKLRQGIPVVILAVDVDKNTCIRAINMGVNGLIEKPLEVPHFKQMVDRHRLTQYELRLNEDRKAVFSKNAWVDLTSTEYKILDTLQSAGRRLTRSELQSAVWPNSTISENNLDTHLTNLKRKIPELTTALNVKRGLGYYLVTKS
jgi:DNA-binding response OmpR family regulator